MQKRQFRPEIAEVYYFRAPTRHAFATTPVQPDTLYVEIMVGGAVYYEGAEYHRGTVFCHTRGQSTLHDFPKGRPYRVLMLLFRHYNRKKWNLPHIGSWRHMESLDSFVHDALEDFTAKMDNETLSMSLFGALRQNLLEPSAPAEDHEGEIPKEIFVAKHELERLDWKVDWHDFSLYHAGYSPGYLRNFFKEQFHISPYQYRLQCRIQSACKLLAETDLSIREISEQTLFKNLETFYRAFKRATGTTPAQYRSRNSQKA